MGLKIVTGRTGTPHVSSNQIQAFNRSLLGDLAILDLGQHFDAVVRDANTIRIYDGCIVVQGIYAVIPHDEYEDVLVEPVSVGNTRIDTIYLHYAKDMETDTETVELDIAQGEEAVNNPVKPDIDAGGDTWEGTTDIRIPLYDVTVTSFETTITAYEYMNVYSPTISELQERIPETTVSGVKGDAESEYRSGNVNITPTNIGLGNVDNTADTDKPVSTAQQSALDEKVDKVTGKGLSTNDYTNEEKQKNADNASAIEDIQEDISQSQTTTGNPITIESSESNLVECVAEVEAVQDLHGYDKPWVGGAGKNKLSVNESTISEANYIFNTNIDLPAGTYTFSFESDVTTNLSLAVQNAGNVSIVNSPINYPARTYTFEISEAGKKVRLYGYAGTYTKMQIEAGNQATSFEPYTNISQITGRTEVVIEDVGKNISTGVEQGSFGTNGVNGSSNTRCRSIGYIPVTTGTEYVLNGKPDNVYASISYFANNTNIERISGTTWESLPYKFTPPSNCRYIRVMFSFDSGAQTNITPSDIINLIIADNPKTYTIQIGDTIYGGELDVLTGELRVTHEMYDIPSTDWINNTNNPTCWILEHSAPNSINVSNQDTEIRIITEFLKGVTAQNIINTITTTGYENTIAIISSSRYLAKIEKSIFATKEDFMAYISANSPKAVYELATPYTIQLTPQQIRLLKGTNNISCNTGDLSIKYYPDNVLGQLKGDIEKGLNAYYDYQIQALWDKINELQA